MFSVIPGADSPRLESSWPYLVTTLSRRVLRLDFFPPFYGEQTTWDAAHRLFECGGVRRDCHRSSTFRMYNYTFPFIPKCHCIVVRHDDRTTSQRRRKQRLVPFSMETIFSTIENFCLRFLDIAWRFLPPALEVKSWTSFVLPCSSLKTRGEIFCPLGLSHIDYRHSTMIFVLWGEPAIIVA